MISFEILFDSDDLCITKILALQKLSHKKIEINTGKRIKMGLECITEEQNLVLQLWKEFADIIAWIYNDLKTYDKSVIQHTIELVLVAKTYR